MKIHITAKQLELTPSIKVYIENKLAPLSRVLGSLDSGVREIGALVEVGRTTKHHRHGEVFAAAIVIELGKKVIRAEASADDLRVAVSEAKEKLEREIRKQKTRLLARRRAK